MLTAISPIPINKLPVVVAENHHRFHITIFVVNLGLLSNNSIPFPPGDHTIFIEPCAELLVTIEDPVLPTTWLLPLPVVVSVTRASVSKLLVMRHFVDAHHPAGAHQVAAVPEVAIGTSHALGVPVIVTPPTLTESVAFATALVICHPEILLFVSVSVEFIETRVSLAPVGSVRVQPDTTIAAILGVIRAGEPARTSPPVPVEAVPPIVGAFVISKSVNQPLVTLVAVAPIVVTKRLAHFFSVVPKSSVLSVSDTRVVFIATEARLDRAVLAPPLAGASRAREPSAWTVRTSPSLPPEKFISSALAVIVQDAMSQGCRAESAKAPCAVVATARSPLPRRVVELTVFIFVPETRVACFVSRPVFKRFTVGYFVVFVSIVVFSLFATFSGTYPIFHSRTDQLLAVCHGVSTNARRLSPLTTGAPPRVPATFINQESHFRIAPAVPEPPEAGKVFTEAS